jgi:hypothetical protein
MSPIYISYYRQYLTCSICSYHHRKQGSGTRQRKKDKGEWEGLGKKQGKRGKKEVEKGKKYL